MLKTIHIGNTLPTNWPADPTVEFQAGMFAQLKVIGNEILASVSDGTAPIGIIDEVRTSSFTRNQIDEIVQISVPSQSVTINSNGKLVSSVETNSPLSNPSIIKSSFTCNMRGIILNHINGIVTVPAGTELNYDFDGDGENDGFKIIVSYVYKFVSKLGDDTTLGSGRMTVWYQRGIFETDQFDTTAIYPINATLYVGLDGKLTTQQPTENHPGVAICLAPPSSVNTTIQFMLL